MKPAIMQPAVMKPPVIKRVGMNQAAGFTLLEVLASLVLLALLLVGVYSGLRTATHSVRSGTAAVARIDQIRSAQQFLQRELAQSMAQPISHNERGENIYFEGSEHELRYVAPLPGYLGIPENAQLHIVCFVLRHRRQDITFFQIRLQRHHRNIFLPP